MGNLCVGLNLYVIPLYSLEKIATFQEKQTFLI